MKVCQRLEPRGGECNLRVVLEAGDILHESVESFAENVGQGVGGACRNILAADGVGDGKGGDQGLVVYASGEWGGAGCRRHEQGGGAAT